MRPQDTISEAGAYYIVPNKYGPGKTVVRRPHPPPTSPPLDDDFDAYTQGWTTTRGPDTERGDNRRDSGVGTSVPLDDDFDAVTYTTPLAPETVAQPESEWGVSDRSPDRLRRHSTTPDLNGYRKKQSGARYGQAVGSGEFERYGEYGQYMNEMEKMFGGGSVDWELSVKKVEDDSQVGRARSVSGSSMGLERRGSKVMQKRGCRNQPGIGSETGRPKGNGPRRGQDYEMVARRVVEDGPERTVTISTWREEVAREVTPDIEMSVYYVDGNDYAIEGDTDGQATEAERQARNIEESTQKIEADRYFTRRHRGPPQADKTAGSSERPTSRRTFSDPTFPNNSQRAKSPQNYTHRSGSPLAKGKTAARTPTPNRVDAYPSNNTVPLTRTSPIKRLAPRTSTPTKINAAPLAFHPTQSGSTISSIKSSSSSLKNILSSCVPSLLHIAPILATLGIEQEDHLRAVARLTDETRDREVKEEALRMGVTVMEWAMFVDLIKKA